MTAGWRFSFFSASASVALAIVSAVAQTAQPPPSIPIPTWKEEIAKNLLPYHQLTTSDFPVKEQADPKFGFWVKPFLQYYYRYLEKRAASGYVYAYVMDWTIFSGFDKNESSRSHKMTDMKAHLPYAQALLDINEIYARELAALQPGELPAGQGVSLEQARSQLNDRLTVFCQARLEQAKGEANAFIEATHQGQDMKKARQLGAQLKKRLEALPSKNPPTANEETISPPVPSPSATPPAATNK
jgi:hypothetical protein